MRPTDLGFRSPKEKTPSAYCPMVTCNGQQLGGSAMKESRSFGRARRFNQYDVDAKKTGFRLGPGLHQNEPRDRRVAGTPTIRPSGEMGNNGYLYVGNQLVLDLDAAGKGGRLRKGTHSTLWGGEGSMKSAQRRAATDQEILGRIRKSKDCAIFY